MRKPTKFRKMHSPAFNAGEEWVGSGGSRVKIVSTRKYENPALNGKWDWAVTYKHSSGTEHEKDGWSFQVRYEHASDRR